MSIDLAQFASLRVALYRLAMAEVRIPVIDQLFILERDLLERFIHSGGPGGQNVNKVASGVQLRYNPRDSGTLPMAIVFRAEKLAGQRLNNEGEIVIQATRHRSQEKNRAEARNRLIELLAKAAEPPPPKRKPTRPSLNARKKRTDSKVKRGFTKKT